MEDIGLEMRCGATIYVEIDIFRFVKDESLTCVEVKIEENGEYKFLEFLGGLEEESIVATHEDLRRVAVKWLLDNVTIEYEGV